MEKFIQIGGDSRSGGSLLARLFDAHPEVLSYPFENEFFANRVEDLFNFKDYRISGDIQDIIKQEAVSKIIKFGKGVLHSKQQYSEEESFDQDLFLNKLSKSVTVNDSDRVIYEKINSCFFSLFNPTKVDSAVAVSNHCSRTISANLDQFYGTFQDAYFIHSLREPKAVHASMKNYAKTSGGEIPQNVPKEFLEFGIDRWLIAVLLGIRNKVKYDGHYFILLYEDLVLDPSTALKKVCSEMGLEFSEEMTRPKYGNSTWGGNSSFGKMPAEVSKKNLEKYKEVLLEEEQNRIDRILGGIYQLLAAKVSISAIENEVEKIFRGRMPEINCHSIPEIRAHYANLYQQMRKIQLGGK